MAHYRKDGKEHRVDADFRGRLRRLSTGSPDRSFRHALLRTHERVYPFGWLGILSPTPPVSDELNLRQTRARFRVVLDAQSNAVALLRPMRRGRNGGGMAR